MKRVILLVLLIGLAGCSSIEPVETVPDDHWTRQPAGVPFARIGRGVTNIVISPLDLPMTMWRVAEEFDEFGYGAGVGQGLFNMTLRLIWGAGETCTFFFITDPEPVYDVGLGERAIFRDDYRPAEMP